MRIITVLMAAASLSMAACAQTGSIEPLALTGSWQVISIDGKPVSSPSYQIVFSQEQQFNAYFGCNNIMGQYQHKGEALSFSPMASTLMACVDEKDESMAIKALGAISSVRVDAVKTSGGLRLSLRDEAGHIRIEAQKPQ